MQVFTSYFDNLKNIPNTIVPVSIAGSCPTWYTGVQYKKLAPKKWFYDFYMKTRDERFYREKFQTLILDNLDSSAVFEHLRKVSKGKDIVLLCYETPDVFCHRHLVAKWLSSTLNIEVKEY